MNKLEATVEILIEATASEVWNAITDPVMVKKYFFGTDLVADWKVGGDIFWRGEWEGKPYEDKGKVLEIVQEKLLVTNYWSSMSGVADLPENYKNISYELSDTSDGVILKITQDNIATEEEKIHSENNWNYVLGEMKKLLES